jgi:Ca2+-binding EF-hand superfamily protein
VLKVEPTPNVFQEMDTNRDMMISYEEMAQWFATMHPDKLDHIPAGLFEREDKNGVRTALCLRCTITVQVG